MVLVGRQAFKQFLPMLRSAFPDLKFHNTIEHMVAERDYIVARIIFHYSNAGEEATASDLSEYRLANGKIVEDRPPTSAADLMQKVGITLPTG